MKTLLLLIAFFVMPAGRAQTTYLDLPGLALRQGETAAARTVQAAAARTAAAYASTTAITTLLELTSRTRLDPFIEPLNYFEYQDVCTYYLNPFRKQICENKYHYLIEAHSMVVALMIAGTGTVNKINQGVKEQIGQKYAHITNIILKELEDLKHTAEKEFFYRRLILGAK